MNRERYLSLMQWARERKEREMILCGMTKWIPFVLAFIYIISILFCIFMYPIAMPRLVFRPLLCFITVTFIRNILKAPRPYDVFDFKPLCGYRPGKNRSFPSRHTASAAILALEIFERLNEEGVACNLLTGEEEVIVEGAHHHRRRHRHPHACG